MAWKREKDSGDASDFGKNTILKRDFAGKEDVRIDTKQSSIMADLSERCDGELLHSGYFLDSYNPIQN
jgi:hypothetical protein